MLKYTMNGGNLNMIEYTSLSFKPNEIITYLRKSRSDNPNESVEDVLERHETQLREYAQHSLNIELSERYILREVISGETIDARPQMQKLLKLIENPDIKAVLAIEPQRLSRGDLEDCGRLINILRFTKTLVITPGKIYDLEDKYDRKFFEMELSRGNDYLEYTKEILRRGVLASVKQGNYLASVAPYGYKKVSFKYDHKVQHSLEIVPEEAAAIQLVYDLYVNKNYGFQRIANYLDEMNIKPRISKNWSAAALKDIIENPVYIGKIRWNWRKSVISIENGEKKISRPKSPIENCILVDGLHKPIISEELYNAALAKRGKNVCVRKNLSLENPFAGLLFCQCGYAMSYKYNHNKSNIKASMVCNQQSRCHTRSVLFDEFLKDVIECMKMKIEDFDIEIKNNDLEISERHQIIIHDLERKLKSLYEKDARQKDAFDDGIYSKEEYLSRNRGVQEEIQKTLQSIKNAKESMPEIVDYKEKKATFEEALQTLLEPGIPAERKNIILKKCIKKIIYRNDMPSQRGIGRYSKNKFSLDIYFNI